MPRNMQENFWIATRRSERKRARGRDKGARRDWGRTRMR
jgi:hypothetical protein